MWTFMLFIAAVIVWSGSAQGEQVYLTTHDNWAFFKVRATGTMSYYNVKNTCEAAGMDFPCSRVGPGSCLSNCDCYTGWGRPCITFDRPYGSDCHTFSLLSNILCGTSHYWTCLPLKDTFAIWKGIFDGTWGFEYGPHNIQLDGDNYSDKYALCAVLSECWSSPCVHGTCSDVVGGYTCSCDYGWGGTNCDQAIANCAPAPCQNGGSCHDDVESYHCICPVGYVGDHCETDVDWCNPDPCKHGFVCEDYVLYYMCTHPSHVRGSPYQCSSDSCLDGMNCTPESMGGYSCKPE